MIKINYYEIGQKTLDSLGKQQQKPTLLLHVCCAPCATYPLELLEPYFTITIYYENSNIYPYDEYQKRYQELQHYLAKNHPSIHLIQPPYRNKEFMRTLALRARDNEGGPRCRYCYFLRLQASYQYAYLNGFDYMTTALTISRKKDAQAINRIGLILQKSYKTTTFLAHDFKKNKGQDRAIALAKEHELYRQSYCGCLYSISPYRNKETT